jgi:hypothetical protein
MPDASCWKDTKHSTVLREKLDRGGSIAADCLMTTTLKLVCGLRAAPDKTDVSKGEHK